MPNEQEIRRLQDEVKKLRNDLEPFLSAPVIDIRGRRVVNASPAIHDNDYILRRQLPQFVQEDLQIDTDPSLEGLHVVSVPKRLDFGALTLDDIRVYNGDDIVDLSDITVRGLYVICPSVSEVDFSTQYTISEIADVSDEITVTLTAVNASPTALEVGDYIFINDYTLVNGRYKYEILRIDAINGSVYTLNRRSPHRLSDSEAWFGTRRENHASGLIAYRIDPINIAFSFKSGLFANPSSKSAFAERVDCIIPNVCIPSYSVAIYNNTSISKWTTTTLWTTPTSTNSWETTDVISPGFRTLNGAVYHNPISGTLTQNQETRYSIPANDNSPLRVLYASVETAPEESAAASTDDILTVQVIEVDPSDDSETVIETIGFRKSEKISGDPLFKPEDRQIGFNTLPNLLGESTSATWPPPYLKKGFRYKAKVTRVGADTAGSDLVVMLAS